MNRHLNRKKHLQRTRIASSNRHQGNLRLSLEPLEARHLLSGMESNWVMADAGVQVAAGPHGSVYTGSVDESGTYYLTRYDAFGELDPNMNAVPLFTGDGLNYPTRYPGKPLDFLYIHDNGDIYVGGTFSGSIAIPATPDLDSQGDTDVFVARFNSSGGCEWSQRFGGSDADTLAAFDVDTSGDLIATGSFEDTATFATGDQLTTAMNKDTPQFVFKLDSETGEPIWYRQLQDSGALDVYDVEVSDSGIFAVANAGRVILDGTRLRKPSTLVVKMDGGGEVSWVHRLTGATRPRGGIVQGPDEALYVSGTFTGTADFGVTELTVQSWEGYWDVYVARIDDHITHAENNWARQFACTQYLFSQGIAVVWADDPTAGEPALVVAGQFLRTTYFAYPDQESGVLTVRQEEAAVSTAGYDAFLVEMQLHNGLVKRVRQLGGTGADTFARLATHPQYNAYNVMFTTNPAPWNQDPSLYDGIVHTPGGSWPPDPATPTPVVDQSILVHVNRQAPQLEVVHVFDEFREEVVSTVEEGRLTFRANVGGMPALQLVTWKVNGVVDTTTNDATLELTRLDLGRHTVEATVPDGNGRTAAYTYTFDVAPNAPANLAAAYADGAMRLNWQVDVNGPTLIEGFEISRRYVEEVDWRDWEVIGSVDNPTQTWFEDGTVEAGQTYEYAVRSIAVVGDTEINSPAVERLTVVAEQGVLSNDIYVWDVYFDQRTRGSKHDARIFIDVNRDSDADGFASGSDAAATGVIATVELREAGLDCVFETADDQMIGAFSGATDAAGIYRSDWIRNLGPGTYRAEVIDLAHAAFDWTQLLTPNDGDEDGDGFPDDIFTIPA